MPPDGIEEVSGPEVPDIELRDVELSLDVLDDEPLLPLVEEVLPAQAAPSAATAAAVASAVKRRVP